MSHLQGKAIQQETSASRLASEIEKAKSFIKQSLETAPLSVCLQYVQ